MKPAACTMRRATGASAHRGHRHGVLPPVFERHVGAAAKKEAGALRRPLRESRNRMFAPSSSSALPSLLFGCLGAVRVSHFYNTRLRGRANCQRIFARGPKSRRLPRADAESVVRVPEDGRQAARRRRRPTSVRRGATIRRGSRDGRSSPSRDTTRGRSFPCRKDRIRWACRVRRPTAPRADRRESRPAAAHRPTPSPARRGRRRRRAPTPPGRQAPSPAGELPEPGAEPRRPRPS